MNLTFIQKFKLFFVYRFIDVLWFIERVSRYTVRFAVLLFVSVCLITGFYVDENKIEFVSNIPLLLASDSPEVLGAQSVDYPLFEDISKFPDISAKSIFAIDLNKNRVLVNYNSDVQLPPASTTKLMTALVSLDLYKLDEYVKIPEACSEIEAQKSGFKPGSLYRANDLILSLLVNSSADAACTLSLGKINYFDFVKLMNKKAIDLGMENTNFTNPIGLDGENGGHVSTARDLFRLANYSIRNSLIDDFVRTKIATVYSINDEPINIWNTNDLLWDIPGTVGIKTGKTEAAGEVLIYRYENTSKDIVIVVMGSGDRFGDTKQVLDWILSNYNWGR